MKGGGFSEVEVKRRDTHKFPLTTPSNYYIVEFSEGRILVDAGAEKLDRALGEGIDAVIVTHWHWDHTYGVTGLEDPVLCAGRETMEILSSLDRVLGEVYKPLYAMGLEVESLDAPIGRFFNMVRNIYSEIVDSFASGKKYYLKDCPVTGLLEYFPCPGHNDDHQCIRVGSYLFVGDNVTLGESPTTINYGEYLATAYTILSREWSRLAPGHGDLISRVEALEYFKSVVDRKNRKMIKVLSLLSRGVEDFNTLLRRVYGVEPAPQSYVQARTLIGYIRLLEDYRVAVIDPDSKPWRVEYVGD